MKVEKITIKHIVDEQPDLSYLGVYSDTPAEICIDRKERGDQQPNEYRYFNLGCGDPAYIERDYLRMEAYSNQQWYSMGIMAEAELLYSTGNDSRRLEHTSPGGLWGIESDSGRDYIEEIQNEQLADLREHLEFFGITITDADWQTLCDNAKNNVKMAQER